MAPPPVPVDNPMSPVKVELGRRLFYDADLSVDGTMSCATCHEQHRAFADGNRTHPGVKGDSGRRNVMSLTNAAYFHALTWGDPRVRDLESQVAIPVLGEHPVEMGMAGQAETLAERLSADPCYRRLFAAAFPERGGRIDMAAVSKAIAAFERTLVSFDAPFDRGELSASARRGRALFASDRLGCASCHSGPAFTDAVSSDGFHRIGRAPPAPTDRGLWEITGKEDEEGRFRTPGLRNVALTAPYLHDGSAATLAEAIQGHDGDGRALPTSGETADILAFLDSLTDRGFVTDPRLALPPARCPTIP